MPNSGQLPVFTKQLTGDAAVTFLLIAEQRFTVPDYPHTADERDNAWRIQVAT